MQSLYDSDLYSFNYNEKSIQSFQSQALYYSTFFQERDDFLEQTIAIKDQTETYQQWGTFQSMKIYGEQKIQDIPTNQSENCLEYKSITQTTSKEFQKPNNQQLIQQILFQQPMKQDSIPFICQESFQKTDYQKFNGHYQSQKIKNLNDKTQSQNGHQDFSTDNLQIHSTEQEQVQHVRQKSRDSRSFNFNQHVLNEVIKFSSKQRTMNIPKYLLRLFQKHFENEAKAMFPQNRNINFKLKEFFKRSANRKKTPNLFTIQRLLNNSYSPSNTSKMNRQTMSKILLKYSKSNIIQNTKLKKKNFYLVSSKIYRLRCQSSTLINRTSVK